MDSITVQRAILADKLAVALMDKEAAYLHAERALRALVTDCLDADRPYLLETLGRLTFMRLGLADTLDAVLLDAERLTAQLEGRL